MASGAEQIKQAMSAIPSVDSILGSPIGIEIERSLGRATALRLIREAVDSVRGPRPTQDVVSRDEIVLSIEGKLRSLIDENDRNRLQRVINATGVIIHTNLGRSSLSAKAVEAIVRHASGYCNVELDLETGERGRRGAAAEKVLAELTGAEDGLIVNNCAAAALLVLSAVAKGGEVLVSRGELVEIGGDFRIPDVLEQSGCTLREVGTTNRTKLVDYERAINDQTKVILHVHPSNFRISGFTESPGLDELADLARRNRLILLEDAGSGALIDLSGFGLGEEPVISRCVASGADVVVFSGDKLVGGVQAGLIVGRRESISKIRRHPLYRAVRADKIVYAAIEATLNSFARGSAFVEIPTLRMLSKTYDEISERATRLVEGIHVTNPEHVTVEMVPGFSAIGGGAGTDVKLPTALIALSHNSLSADELAAALRLSQTPILARINEGRVLIDLRTVNESDDEIILSTLKQIRVG